MITGCAFKTQIIHAIILHDLKKTEKYLVICAKLRTFAAAFRVIAGRKIGELPVMLRRNDNNNRLIIKYKWI